MKTAVLAALFVAAGFLGAQAADATKNCYHAGVPFAKGSHHKGKVCSANPDARYDNLVWK